MRARPASARNAPRDEAFAELDKQDVHLGLRYSPEIVEHVHRIFRPNNAAKKGPEPRKEYKQPEVGGLRKREERERPPSPLRFYDYGSASVTCEKPTTFVAPEGHGYGFTILDPIFMPEPVPPDQFVTHPAAFRPASANPHGNAAQTALKYQRRAGERGKTPSSGSSRPSTRPVSKLSGRTPSPNRPRGDTVEKVSASSKSSRGKPPAGSFLDGLMHAARVELAAAEEARTERHRAHKDETRRKFVQRQRDQIVRMEDIGLASAVIRAKSNLLSAVKSRRAKAKARPISALHADWRSEHVFYDDVPVDDRTKTFGDLDQFDSTRNPFGDNNDDVHSSDSDA